MKTPSRQESTLSSQATMSLPRTINVQSIWHCGHFGPFWPSRISNLPVFNGMDSSTPAASTNSIFFVMNDLDEQNLLC